MAEVSDRIGWWLRVLCPLVAALSLAVGIWSWVIGNYGLAAVNAFLLGANVMQTWVQWAIMPTFYRIIALNRRM